MQVVILENILESLGNLPINGVVDLQIDHVLLHRGSLLSRGRDCLGSIFALLILIHLELRGTLSRTIHLFARLLLLFLVDERVQPLEGIDKLAREPQIIAL